MTEKLKLLQTKLSLSQTASIIIDRIAALPKEHREMIAQLLLSIPYLTGTTHGDWNSELFSWIPKEERNGDMRKAETPAHVLWGYAENVYVNKKGRRN